jgi:hypothetical protein
VEHLRRTQFEPAKMIRRRISVIEKEPKAIGCKRYSRLIYFIPLAVLFLERVYIPFELDLNHDLQERGVATQSKISQATPDYRFSTKVPPLDKLAAASVLESCPNKFQKVENVHLPVSVSLETRKIPRIVHQTSKSRCLTAAFTNVTSHWKLSGWSYYFHDDDAIDRLLKLEFPEFPHLQTIFRDCVTNGTLKADLWRYLVLWVYGGVYADFDSAPNKFSFDTIDDSDDGFFVVEQYHILSQWFMAVSPRHPLMYYAIQHSLLNLLGAEDTQQIGAHAKTGPHALHKAYMDFRKDAGAIIDPVGPGFKPVRSGLFTGSQNRTIKVVGVGENENEFVQRLAIKHSVRMKDYKKMGMTHFSKFIASHGGKKSGSTCLGAMLSHTFAAINKRTT